MLKISDKYFFPLQSLILTLFAILVHSCNDTTPIDTHGKFLNHNKDAQFVGKETCKSCHEDKFNTFINTGMGKSFDLATKQKSSAKFGPEHIVYDTLHNLYYHPFWINDSLYIMEYRLSGNDTIHKRVEKVDYIIGSGQHTNSHMMNVNGFVYQLPMTWYAQDKKWDLPPGYENGRNVRFSRSIETECMSCHNAMPVVAKNSLNKFLVVPQGINCERCHGPGSEHVREMMSRRYVDTATQIDYSIVNPRKLPWERQIDICQRCHLQGNSVLKRGKTFSDFKPGMILSDFQEVFLPKYKDRDDEFIMASHAQRLQRSKCFIVSNNNQNTTANKNFKSMAFTCTSCHNPHVSVQITGKQIFNNACIKCHKSADACTYNKDSLETANFDCVKCHMPRSGTLDIPHVSVHDHWIRKPQKKIMKTRIKEFIGIYCVNNPNPDNLTKAKAYLSYFEKFEGEKSSLDSAKLYLNKTKGNYLEKLETFIHYNFLRKAYKENAKIALKLNVKLYTNPWFCYRIGQSFQHIDDAYNAEIWYRKAHQIADQNLDFANKLASSLIEIEKINEAIEIMKSSLAKNEKQEEVWINIGFANVKLNNFEEALKCYNKAISLNPDQTQALLNRAAVYNIMGSVKEAKKDLERILQINPQEAQVRAILKSLSQN